MARLISKATGNFTANTTWGLVNAASLLDSEAATQVVSTSNLDTTAFVPGAVTVDGVALKLNARAVSPSGTVTVTLRDSTASVDKGTVTVNVADLPVALAANNDGGWVFFKFSGGAVLLTAGNNHLVRAVCSTTGSQVTFYRDGTANNFSRLLRETSDNTPATADILHVVGELTGAGTNTARAVTMDETSSTNDYGAAGAADTIALTVSNLGTLAYGTTASTAYYLRLSGNLLLYLGGTVTIGTTGTPMPSTSSAVLEFDPASADGDYGLVVRGGTCTAQGNPITTTATLAADAAAAATSLTTNVSTGWKNGDVIALASTTRTSTECESKALTADAVTTALTIAALTNAHSGTSPTAGELLNLTRNVKVRSRSTTLMAFVSFGIAATSVVVVDWDYVEVSYVGANVTAKKGLECSHTTGSSVNFSYGSIHDTDFGGWTVTNGSPTIDHSVLYNTNTANTAATIGAITLGGSNAPTASTCTVILSAATNGNGGILVTAVGSSVTSCVVSGIAATGTQAGAFVWVGTVTYTGTFSGNVAHGNAGRGFVVWGGAGTKVTLSTCTAWRNNGEGFYLNATDEVICVSCIAFGNNPTGFLLNAALLAELRSPTAYGGTTLVQTNGAVAATGHLRIFDGSFGTPSANSTTDLSSIGGDITAWNTTLTTSTEATVSANTSPIAAVRSQKNDASSTTFKTWYRFGTLVNEATIRQAASGYSWLLTPNSASRKLVLPGPTRFDTFKTAVNSGTLVTVTAYVLKNAAYNGAQPRLVLVGGIVGGIGSAGTDVVATAAEAQKTITAATNATPIAITTSAAHGYTTGDRVYVQSVGGNTAANGIWTITVTSSTAFTLDSSIGNGAYTSGGTANRWELLTVTGTPNELAVIEYYVDADGTAGSVYVDTTTVTQA